MKQCFLLNGTFCCGVYKYKGTCFFMDLRFYVAEHDHSNKVKVLLEGQQDGNHFRRHDVRFQILFLHGKTLVRDGGGLGKTTFSPEGTIQESKSIAKTSQPNITSVFLSSYPTLIH